MDAKDKLKTQFHWVFGAALTAKLAGKYWIGLMLYLLSYLGIEVELSQDTYLVLASILQLIGAILLAFAIGYFSWKFSGKKIDVLWGLLGFIWIAFIGPLVGYYIVDKKSREVHK